MARGSGRRWLLLLGVGLITLVVVVLLFYGHSSRSVSLPPVAGLASYGVTARQALAPAAELAAQWQEDAQLAVASCYRPAVGKRPEDEIEWTFQFFSSATQRLALIVVAGGEARVVRESLSPYAVPTFSTEQWPVDSDQALQVWWDRGGSTVLGQRPDADLAMELSMSDEGGEYPVWTVAGLVGGAENAFIVSVNATNGALVEP
jgi:hypothetical protein